MKVLKVVLPAMMCFVFSVQSQPFYYVDEDTKASISAKPVDKDCDFASGEFGDYFYTSPVLRLSPKIKMYDKQTMEMVWAVEMEKKWEYKGKKLSLDTAIFLNDGSTLVISWYNNKKREQIELFGKRLDVNGKELETKPLAEFKARSFTDIKVTPIISDSTLVLLAISGQDKKEASTIQCAWLNNNLDPIQQQAINLNDPSKIDNYSYDSKRKTLYVATTYRTVSKIAVRIKSQRVVSFNINDLKPKVKLLDFEEATASVNYVWVDESTGTPYLFGMAGPKKTQQLSTLFAIALSPSDLSVQKTKFFQISGKAVKDLMDSKKGIDNFYDGSNAAFFKLQNVLRNSDRVYVIFENVNSFGNRYGQFVVEFDKNFNEANQHYLGNYGLFNSEANIDNQGQLHVYFMAELKHLQERVPDLEGTKQELESGKSINKNSGLIEAIISGDDVTYKTLFVVDREMELFSYLISHCKRLANETELYITASKGYYNRDKTYIRVVTTMK